METVIPPDPNLTNTTYTIIETLVAQIIAVRQLHSEDPAGYCRECTNPHPCKTYKLTDPRTPEESPA